MKAYIIKIYEPGGTYVTSVNEKIRLSKIEYKESINGGQGNLNLTIQSDFEFPPSWAVLNYFLKVFVVKIKNKVQTEDLLYTGSISQIDYQRDGSNEYLSLSILGLSGLLGLGMYKEGSSFDVQATTVDPGVIVADIIAKCNANTEDWLTAGANIVNTGTVVSYKYEKKRWLEALNDTLKLSGSNYYWFIGADGDVEFQAIPTPATHKFNVLRDVNRISVKNSTEDIMNDVTVQYSSGTQNAQNSSSAGFYFRRDSYIFETELNATGATQVANFNIEKGSEPKIKVQVEINNKYDIESIHPGQTCSFFGTKLGSTTLGGVFTIFSVGYSEQLVTLELSDDFGSFGNQLTKYVDNKVFATSL